jgi:Flp pilus assembly protein CpaB
LQPNDGTVRVMPRPTGPGADLSELRARAADLLHTHRRTASAALAAVGIVFAVTAARPHPPASTSVWVAAHDLLGGAPLSNADVRLETLPKTAVPKGALTDAHSPVGMPLGAPMRRGEPLTDDRVLSTALVTASGAPSDVAVPVRVTDGPAALALVKAGERIAVITAGDPGTGVATHARTVVEDVRVLAVPTRLTNDDAGLLIVAATPHEARALAALSDDDRVSIAVQH